MAISEEWLRVIEVVDPGFSPAKAPVIEVINMMMIIMINMMDMTKMMIKTMTQELAGAKMQLLRRNQEEVGKVR